MEPKKISEDFHDAGWFISLEEEFNQFEKNEV